MVRAFATSAEPLAPARMAGPGFRAARPVADLAKAGALLGLALLFL
jgi:hypothetical protein